MEENKKINTFYAMYKYICIYIYVYMYVYRERKRDTRSE